MSKFYIFGRKLKDTTASKLQLVKVNDLFIYFTLNYKKLFISIDDSCDNNQKFLKVSFYIKDLKVGSKYNKKLINYNPLNFRDN